MPSQSGCVYGRPHPAYSGAYLRAGFFAPLPLGRIHIEIDHQKDPIPWALFVLWFYSYNVPRAPGLFCSVVKFSHQRDN